MSGGARVTVVCGACGGAGASLLAGALALAAAAGGAPAWLVDLDHERGDLAPAWGVEGERTTADLLAVRDELTPAQLRRAARPHRSGVAVLAAPAAQGSAAPWDDAMLRALLDAVREAVGPGGEVVIDAPGATPALARAADRSLLVCPPTLCGARRAVARVATAGSLVVAGLAVRRELSHRTLARVAGLPVAAELPWSPREAASLGAGCWRVGRRGGLARAVRALAAGAP